ncbi:phage tail tape measure protein [Secundilactobacillus pentosiphilus]|uniref:Phage tail tape measure protein n=1 Tax=Secundilactobacillus pentosiphilus TaxID=1714682 RepID=A0A1Z5IUD8_9LACO|nr:phage tail tape measure protein [Secundilactobacillus pentosiphilus]GAX05365.1 phage tail tape measure protein [Secundilactobacillus pentosiphilus]
MARVQDEMATRVTIDTIGAVKSYKALSSAVRSSVNAWKSQEAQLKSVGRYSDAAQAKVDGLSKSMTLQRDKINELIARQKGLDTSTASGQRQYMKLENQIQSANRQISNYSAQLERAKSASKYYTSGLADLQNGYKQTMAVSQSYVKRLESEGRTLDANREKFRAAQSGYVNLSKQVEKQSSEQQRLQHELESATSAYDKQVAKLRTLRNTSGENSDAFKKESATLSDLSAKVNRSTDALNKQKIRTNESAASMNSARRDVIKFKDSLDQLNHPFLSKIKASFTGVDREAKRSSESIKKSFGSSTIGKAAKGIAISSGVGFAAIGAAATSGIKKAANLQNEYKKTYNLLITSGEKAAESQRNVNRMQKEGSKYSVQYGVSQEKIAGGYQELIKRGYSSTQALGAMKSMLQASKASGDDFNDVVHNTTATIEAFGMKSNSTSGMIKNSKKVVNELAYSADLTATDFNSMGVAMEYVGSSAHNSGLRLSEISSAIGILSNNGLEAQKAGTGLRKVIQSIQKPTSAAQKALSSIGLSTSDFVTKSGKMKSLTDIMGLLNEHTKNMSKFKKGQLFSTIFGATGQQAATILANNVDQMGKLNQKVKDSADGSGYVAKLAKKNQTSVKAEMGQFKAASDAAMIMIGKQLLPILSKASVGMAKAFNSKAGRAGLRAIARGVGDVAKLLVDSIEYLGKHTQQVKTFGVVLAGIFATKKILDFIMYIRRARDALMAFKAVDAVSSLGDKGAAAKTATTVGEDVAGTAATSKVTGSFGKRLATKALPLGKSIGGRLLAGLGIALSAYDIVKGLTSKKKKTQYKKVGAGAGGLIGAGIGGAIAGPPGAAIGSAIGSVVGGAVGGATRKFEHGWNAWAKGYKPRGFVAKVGFDYHEGAHQLNNYIAGVEKHHHVIGFAIRIAEGGRKLWKERGQLYGRTMQLAASTSWDGIRDLSKKNWHGLLKDMRKNVSTWSKGIKSDIGNIWDSLTGSRKIEKEPKRKKQPAKKETTRDAIKKVATTHVSKRDIANVRSMTAAIKLYTSTLRGLKTSIRKNDPTKELNKMNSRLNSSIKSWDKLASPIKKMGDAFKVLASFSKSMSHNDAFAELNHDLPKLQRTLKDSKVGNYIKDISNDIKNSKITQNMRAVTKSLSKDIGTWKSIAKPIKTMSGSFDSLKKSMKSLSGKKDPFHSLDKHIKTLHQDLKKYNIGKAIKSMVTKVNDATKDLKSVKKFNSSIKSIGAATHSAQKTISKFITTIKRSWKSAWNGLGKTASSGLKSADRKITDRLGDIRGDLSSSEGKMTKGWRSFWNGLNGISSSKLKDIRSTVNKGIGKIIDTINRGIKGINGVISKFGGNTTTISPIKFATGTGAFSSARRPITHPTWAMLNDGNDSPETNNREIAMLPNGQMFSPTERNWTGLVPAGTEVFNARESAALISEHFASGTGFLSMFDNGMSKEMKKLYSKLGGGLKKLIGALQGFNSKPTQSFNVLMDNKPDVSGDVLDGISKTFTKATKNQGQKWWSTVWSMASDALGSGDGSAAGGKWAHSPGSGWTLTSGFGYRGPVAGGESDHDGNDFSGGRIIHAVHGGKVIRVGGPPSAGWSAVGTSIITKGSDGQYVIYQEFGRPSDAKVKVGDDVKTGDVIGQRTGTHVHIGVSRNYPFHNNGATTRGWENLLKMHGGSDGSSKSSKKKKPKITSGMQKLVGKETGGMMKWIKKHLAPLEDDGGSIGSFNLSGSIVSRAKSLASALKKLYPAATRNGISAILGNWEFESGLNPGIRNGIGASGLGQWLNGRFTNLESYARKHGKSWKDPSMQLEFALRGEGSDSAIFRKIVSGHGSIASLANAFSSEWERGGFNAQHVAGASRIAAALKGFKNGGLVSNEQLIRIAEDNKKEMVVPWDQSKRSLAYQELDATMKEFGKTDSPKKSKRKSSVFDDSDNGSLSDLLTVQTAVLKETQAQNGLLRQILGALTTSSDDPNAFEKLVSKIGQAQGKKVRNRVRTAF